MDKLLTSKLAESPTAKAGLEDMRLLLSYCKLYTCSEVALDIVIKCSLSEKPGGKFRSEPGQGAGLLHRGDL